MSERPEHIDFRQNTATVDPHMARSVQSATRRFLGNRQALVDAYGNERWEDLRTAGNELRRHTLAHLDVYLEQLERQVTAAGGTVHWARDAEEARQVVLSIAREHGVRSAVKVKSMASEEIDLNGALERAGIAVRETDLGEYIVQLAGVMPSHIIVPAVHLTKEGIADLFERKLGVTAPPEPTRLTELARSRLRQDFLAADMGISGANFMVAETGSIVLVTNEGNGRMCTTLPPLHVAVAGIDKVLPDLESLSVVLKLLPRNATGQKMTTYTTVITGPSQRDDEGGPREFHLVLLDCGRTRILADDVTRDTLLCIRCGACLNVCPVYNEVGGHAYGWVYSGPIGSILAPQLLGGRAAGGLAFASSLCGACAEVCPVKIPIPEILLRLRRRVVEGDAIEPASASPVLRLAGEAAGVALSHAWLYNPGRRAARFGQEPLRRGDWLPSLPPPLNRWTMARPMMALRAGGLVPRPTGRPEGATRRSWRETTRRAGLAGAIAVLAASMAWLLTHREKR